MSEAADAMGGRVLCGDAGVHFDGIAIDSRKVAGSELFFALEGEHTDGHRFVDDALVRGACGAVVHREPEELPSPGGALVLVEDTYDALHDLTRRVRRSVPRRLVGITGSAGKTTTKEILVAVLGRGFRTAGSPGNLNNLYGFPVALLSIPDDTEWMVAEMGMSVPGELGGVSRLGRPDAVVFTNILPAHLERFGSVEAVAEAKAEILEGLVEGGLVVANAGDPQVVRIVRRHLRDKGGDVVWYGLEGEGEGTGISPEVVARDVEPAPEKGSSFILVAGEERLEMTLPLHGLYNVENCVAAVACAWRLGVPLSEIRGALLAVEPVAMRGVTHRLGRDVLLIDDSYNSNPDALRKALESARRLPAARRWTVLGDMLELGGATAEFHRRAGQEAARLGFEPVVGVGEAARELVDAARESGVTAHWFPDAEAAAPWVVAELRAKDLLLIKGSRGVGLERVVETVLAEAL